MGTLTRWITSTETFLPLHTKFISSIDILFPPGKYLHIFFICDGTIQKVLQQSTTVTIVSNSILVLCSLIRLKYCKVKRNQNYPLVNPGNKIATKYLHFLFFLLISKIFPWKPVPCISKLGVCRIYPLALQEGIRNNSHQVCSNLIKGPEVATSSLISEG